MVESEEGEFHSALWNVLADALGITPTSHRLPDAGEDGDHLDFVDEILVADDTTYYVSAKNQLSRNDVARAFLARRLVSGGDGQGEDPVFVLLAKRVPDRVREIASEVGITVIQLNWDFPLPSRKSPSVTKISKISHPSSWKIVTRLIWSGPSSIRHLSKLEGVSYSWTHATVTRLIDMGVAQRTRAGVKVVDLDRLMDGVSWERPLGNLLVDEIPIEGTNYLDAAREIVSTLSGWGVEHAFTAFTSGGLYTGHSQRFDRLYIYIRAETLNELSTQLSSRNGNIKLNIYRPDRDVFEDAGTEEGLRTVSPRNTLLDLIGLGYKARTLAREMVDRYASTPDE